jgi:hypothetical protein
MKRTKRINIRRIAVGVAFAALIVPAGAQAKPQPADGPVLNPGYGVGLSSDDRAVSRATSVGVVSQDRAWGPIGYTRYAATSSPDDRAFSKATSVGRVPYSGKVQSGDDSSKYAATAFVLVLLAMSSIALLVWRNHKGGKLSPA